MNIERLDRVISSYAGDDSVLYNEIAEELSRYMHRQGTDMEMEPGELSNDALSCLTQAEEYYADTPVGYKGLVSAGFWNNY
jgi:hypothetical protein